MEGGLTAMIFPEGIRLHCCRIEIDQSPFTETDHLAISSATSRSWISSSGMGRQLRETGKELGPFPPEFLGAGCRAVSSPLRIKRLMALLIEVSSALVRFLAAR